MGANAYIAVLLVAVNEKPFQQASEVRGMP